MLALKDPEPHGELTAGTYLQARFVGLDILPPEFATLAAELRMTSEQFCDLPPSERFKLELLNGEVLMAARPAPTHQHFIFQLAVIIDQWIKAHKLGRVLLDTLMKLDGVWTPAPDICFLRTSHLKRVQKKRIVGPVDLAIEVVSPTTERVDRVTKLAA